MKYTIGEIYRMGLLKTSTGQAYSAKSTVSKELRGKPHEVVKTAFGDAKVYDKSVIDELNARWNGVRVSEKVA